MTDVERRLLLRLADGRCKLRRYPSGQWSRGGNKFSRTRDVERMRARQWIELVAVTNQGIELYDITDVGRRSLQRDLDGRLQSTGGGG